MEHTIHINNDNFNNINEDKKTTHVLLNKGVHRSISPDDKIKFCNDDFNEIIVTVKDIKNYDKIEKIIINHSNELYPDQENTNEEHLIKLIELFKKETPYQSSDVDRYGLAIISFEK